MKLTNREEMFFKAMGDNGAAPEPLTRTERILANVINGGEMIDPLTEEERALANMAGMVKPSGSISITENGENIDVSQYASANVSVSGGSSDFSTAVLTITNNSAYDFNPCGAFVMQNDENEPHNYTMNIALSPAHAITDIIVATYKGHAIITLDTTGNPVSCEGNITRYGDTNYYDLTDDAAITITGNN